MTALYGFGSEAEQPKDYKCDCTLCGENQKDWTSMSNTQKMVRALIVTSQFLAHNDANKTPFSD